MNRKAWIAFVVVQAFGELGPSWAGIRIKSALGPALCVTDMVLMIPGRLLASGDLRYGEATLERRPNAGNDDRGYPPDRSSDEPTCLTSVRPRAAFVASAPVDGFHSQLEPARRTRQRPVGASVGLGRRMGVLWRAAQFPPGNFEKTKHILASQRRKA